MSLYSLNKTYRDRILEQEHTHEYREQGFAPMDLHVHSSCSYDVLPSPDFHPEAIYQKAYDLGMEYITITDHDTMDAYDIIGWERERLVTGVEITLLDPIRVGHTLHINVYQLDRKQYEELRQIARFDQNIETFIEFVRDQNLPYTYNHPFWFVAGEKPNFGKVEEIIELFPVIEYNMKRVRKKNLLAMWLAQKYTKGITASTDTHVGAIGRAYTLSSGDTFNEYFNNIVEGNSFIVPQDLTLQNLNHEILSWIEVLFDLEVVLESKTRFTGIQPVDACINFLASHTCADFPRTFPVLESILREIAMTGIFSTCYLFSQNRTAKKIGRMLEIPDLP